MKLIEKPLRCTARIVVGFVSKEKPRPVYKICNKIAKWTVWGSYRCGHCSNTKMGRLVRFPLVREAEV